MTATSPKSCFFSWLARSCHTMRLERTRSAHLKRLLRLKRRSRKPGWDTSRVAHDQATGQMLRCLAINANLVWCPSWGRLRPVFEASHAPPEAGRPLRAGGDLRLVGLHQALPGKACCGTADTCLIHRGSTVSWISGSRAAWATLTPPSRRSLTASTLNSRGLPSELGSALREQS